jgi:antibiotic biosynthesis monooxygenase (ABM) superfamily enzyme
MPKKTKKEYETVEKEIKYTECDVPGCFHTDEEKELIELAVNPRYTVTTEERPTIVAEFDDYMEADKWVYSEEKKLRDSKISHGFDDEISYHGGYTTMKQATEARSDASFFVCQDCLKNHFDAVPDRYNPEQVSEIDSKKGRLVITQEINPILPLPTWLLIGMIIINMLILYTIAIF